jgi:hypothetical protein
VKPPRAAVPELDHGWDDPVAAPERRTSDRFAFEPGFDLAIPHLQRVAAVERCALLRCPCADLALSRTAGEVGIGLLPGDALDAPLDTNLLFERRPVLTERRGGIALEVARFPAPIVRVEHESARINSADEHDPH